MADWKRLAGLFTARWRHPDPAVRRRAAMGLRPTDPADAATLQSLAQDRAPQVREAAVKRLTDLPTLRGYLGKDPDQRVRTAAAVRYRQLLIGDTDTETVRRELERARDPTLLAHIAQQGRAPEVR
ncbi:HEAT repeat domain-containing protein, partial [Halorhodospira neutriphila]